MPNTTEQRRLIGEIGEWLGNGSMNMFGAPMAGKDTQGDRWVDVLNATKIGSGDIFRSVELRADLERIMKAGGILPTPDFVEIVTPHLANPDLTGPLVLSSVGRALVFETVRGRRFGPHGEL